LTKNDGKASFKMKENNVIFDNQIKKNLLKNSGGREKE
jgi:hypothetical protein